MRTNAGIKYTCPKCGGHEFAMTANLEINDACFISGDGKISLAPDAEEKIIRSLSNAVCEEGLIWTCRACGHAGYGAEFATEPVKTSKYVCPHCGNRRLFRATTYEAHDFIMDGDGECLSSTADCGGTYLNSPYDSDADLECGMCGHMDSVSAFTAK